MIAMTHFFAYVRTMHGHQHGPFQHRRLIKALEAFPQTPGKMTVNKIYVLFFDISGECKRTPAPVAQLQPQPFQSKNGFLFYQFAGVYVIKWPFLLQHPVTIVQDLRGQGFTLRQVADQIVYECLRQR